jgi:hypothetical protein
MPRRYCETLEEIRARFKLVDTFHKCQRLFSKLGKDAWFENRFKQCMKDLFELSPENLSDLERFLEEQVQIYDATEGIVIKTKNWEYMYEKYHAYLIHNEPRPPSLNAEKPTILNGRLRSRPPKEGGPPVRDPFRGR